MSDRFYTGILRLVEIGIPPKIRNHLVLGQTNNTLASAYLAADLDLSATAAWYELGSGSEVMTESFDYGRCYSTTTGRYTFPMTGVYFASIHTQIKVKDDSETLIAAHGGIGLDGAAWKSLSGYYGPEIYNITLTGYYVFGATAGQTLSHWVYAAESASSQPTVLAGAMMSVGLLGRI